MEQQSITSRNDINKNSSKILYLKGSTIPPKPTALSKNIDQSSEKKRKIVCQSCLVSIADISNRRAINGSFFQKFVNPIGVTFNIYIFGQTENTRLIGDPTSLHSWFQGYWWNFVHCQNCETHLGWFYQNSRDSFYGLIIDKLKGI